MNPPSKAGTVALVVRREQGQSYLIEALSDEQEIGILEAQIRNGDQFPLESVYQLRSDALKEEEEFGDYVEELLCKPVLSEDVRKQGVQWMLSKIKIEEFQKHEKESVRTIAGYAYEVYQEDPSKTDFMLAGRNAKVRIRVFELDEKAQTAQSA